MEWSHGRALVSSVAGMLREVELRLPGRAFAPFAQAPWHDDASVAELPGHLRTLGAEFIGLPFGSAGLPIDAGPEWNGSPLPPQPPHGIVADGDWSVVEAGPERIELAIELPDSSDIARVERVVSGRPGSAALDLELRVHARRPTRVPIGLHPILRLPTRARELELGIAFDEGLTYPGSLDPSTASMPRSRFRDLRLVPARSGGTLDLSRLPLPRRTEEVVQLLTVTSPVHARYLREAATLTIRWDHGLLPSVLLWISDRSLTGPPWSGRYRGVGIEPIASAFDLPPSVSTRPNPIASWGVSTDVVLQPGSPLLTHYSLEGSPA